MTEYAQPLVLVSPMMRGQNVKDAQYLMAGHSRFDGLAPYKDGPIDGIYGRDSERATERTKFWLGYPTAGINGVFGQTLYEYLRPNNWRPLPSAYRERRAERLAAAVQTPGQKALAEATKYLGVKESPFGSNRQQFGEEYGFNGVAWCAIFESCMFKRSGYIAANGRWRFRYSFVPTIYDDARNGRNGLRLVYTPQPGDLALFDIHGEQLAHTAFVRQSPTGGTFVDLGGNTGPIDVSNGGEVASQTRPTSMIHAWVRVGG